MRYRVVRGYLSMPALLALVLVMSAPLLHRVHLLEYAVDTVAVDALAGAEDAVSAGIRSVGSAVSRSAAGVPHESGHDRQHCPVCRMLKSLYSGFSLPSILFALLLLLFVGFSIIFSRQLSYLASSHLFVPRAPPLG